MNPSVDILVTNRNTREAIQLCVESVRFYTEPGTYRLVVYDDASTNNIDIPYLREKRDAGWLTLIEGRECVLHGGALNILVNDICDSRYAVIIDSDVEILHREWLPRLVEMVSGDDKAIAAVNCLGVMPRNMENLVAPFGEWWFGILDMRSYRDGMETDWRPIILRERDEFDALPNAAKLPVDKLESYIFDVGCKLCDKVLHDNPKGYRILSPLPMHIKETFRHYGQVSGLAEDEAPGIKQYIMSVMSRMGESLERLRHG